VDVSARRTGERGIVWPTGEQLPRNRYAEYGGDVHSRPRPGASEDLAHEKRLRALYDEVDGLLANYTCGRSTECCRFAVNNREPYVTSLEMEVVRKALGALGGVKAVLASQGKNKQLPTFVALAAQEGRCPLLGADDRCRIYASRPFGCRTFFCDRIEGGKLPRKEIAQLAQKLDGLAQAHDPASPKGRPFRGALAAVEARR
jgi:Fe-S-cluster containining protein